MIPSKVEALPDRPALYVGQFPRALLNISDNDIPDSPFALSLGDSRRRELHVRPVHAIRQPFDFEHSRAVEYLKNNYYILVTSP